MECSERSGRVVYREAGPGPGRKDLVRVYWALFFLQWEVIGEFRKTSNMILFMSKKMSSAEYRINCKVARNSKKTNRKALHSGNIYGSPRQYSRYWEYNIKETDQVSAHMELTLYWE